MWKRVLLFFMIILLLMQFFRIEKATPESDPAADFIRIEEPSEQVVKLLREACYDCHSHETVYPWYADIAPVSWWMADHVDEAREHLNFSTWSHYDRGKMEHKMEEAVEYVENREMPLPSYTWMHADARLTDEQRETLVHFFQEKYHKYQ